MSGSIEIECPEVLIGDGAQASDKAVSRAVERLLERHADELAALAEEEEVEIAANSYGPPDDEPTERDFDNAASMYQNQHGW